MITSTRRTNRVIASLVDNIVMVLILLAFLSVLPYNVDEIYLSKPLSDNETLTTGTLILGITVRDVLSMVVSVLYLIVIPMYWVKQTVGRATFGFRLYKIDGEKIEAATWKDYFFREVIVIILLSIITFGLFGIISVFASLVREDKRCLHDVLSKTIFLDDDHVCSDNNVI